MTGIRLASYPSVLLVVKIGQGLSDGSGPALFDAIGHAQGLDVGLTAPLPFTTGGVGGLPRLFNSCLFATQVRAGAEA